MKTTIELPDALFARARRHAEARGITMKALVEEGLRKAMAQVRDEPRFQLRDASFHGGSGMAPEFQGASWERIRDTIYEGRG